MKEIKTKIGMIGIGATKKGICCIRFSGHSGPDGHCGRYGAVEKQQQAKCVHQLKEYFAGKRKNFSVSVILEGTAFQKKVWRELQKIPYGQTATYGEIARRVGSPNAARAVGGACNKNKIPIIIPCHRVVGANGQLVGFAGGLNLKRNLLQLETK